MSACLCITFEVNTTLSCFLTLRQTFCLYHHCISYCNRENKRFIIEKNENNQQGI